ncbi:DUF485 domain-containing protein, partial [Corynebacterium bovis]|uniref:DUF485 domain-containing protein n=1 Tax=Corynebacterium bovis TaxID=36808 RepID=UPI0031392273
MSTAPPGTAPAPTPEQFRRTRDSAEFIELRRRIRSFTFPATVAGVLWFIVYVTLAMFAPGFYSTPVLGRINVAIVMGVLQFVLTFAVTWIYVRYADREIEPRTRAIRERLEAEARAAATTLPTETPSETPSGTQGEPPTADPAVATAPVAVAVAPAVAVDRRPRGPCGGGRQPDGGPLRDDVQDDGGPRIPRPGAPADPAECTDGQRVRPEHAHAGEHRPGEEHGVPAHPTDEERRGPGPGGLPEADGPARQRQEDDLRHPRARQGRAHVTCPDEAGREVVAEAVHEPSEGDAVPLGDRPQPHDGPDVVAPLPAPGEVRRPGAEGDLPDEHLQPVEDLTPSPGPTGAERQVGGVDRPRPGGEFPPDGPGELRERGDVPGGVRDPPAGGDHPVDGEPDEGDDAHQHGSP